MLLTDKKEYKIFLIHNETLKGSVQSHIWLSASSCMVKYVRISSWLGRPSSYMTFPSEFPHIWGKFYFLFLSLLEIVSIIHIFCVNAATNCMVYLKAQNYCICIKAYSCTVIPCIHYSQSCESRRQTISSISRPRFREIWKVSSLSRSLPLLGKKSRRDRDRYLVFRDPTPPRTRARSLIANR